jgi:hypothetical protein
VHSLGGDFGGIANAFGFSLVRQNCRRSSEQLGSRQAEILRAGVSRVAASWHALNRLDVARHRSFGASSAHETQLKSFLPSTKPNFTFDFERVFLST